MRNSLRACRWMVMPTLGALLLAMVLVTPGDRAQAQVLKGSVIGFCDGSVRTLTLGPFAIGPNDSGHSRLLLPAVQRAVARVWVLDSHGQILHVQDFTNPLTPPATGELPAVQSFFDVAFDLSMDDRGTLMFGDGSVRKELGTFQSPEDVSVLIGLLLPAVQKIDESPLRASWGSMRFAGGGGTQILPYMEHPNLVPMPGSL